jgi:hypothetical protein
MKAKKLDCVQMKRLGAAQVQGRTASLTKEQELALCSSAHSICAGVKKPSRRTPAKELPDRRPRRRPSSIETAPGAT